MIDAEWTERSKRDRGWEAAVEAHRSTGYDDTDLDLRTRLCIKSRDRGGMTSDCWKSLRVKYPQNEVDVEQQAYEDQAPERAEALLEKKKLAKEKELVRAKYKKIRDDLRVKNKLIREGRK